MGRPRKYTRIGLEKAVQRYFDSISREVTVTEKVDSGERDDKGHVIWEQVPIINKLGEEIRVTEFAVPPTVQGLCRFLGIHRSTWAEYCDPEKYPEFSDTTTRARGCLREYLENELLTRPGKDVAGIKFVLQNDYDQKERYEMELGEKAAASVQGMTLAEREQLLRQIGQEFADRKTEETDKAERSSLRA
jgi:hypothetical protein